jgi:hypothetical protein
MNPGTYVIDTDDDDPNLAVVLHHSATAITEWTITPSEGEERSVAADNPEYAAEEPVVVVAFVESGLDRYWPEWTDAAPEELYEGVQATDMKRYHFPESRLTVLDDQQVAAVTQEPTVAMDALQARLTAADWQTELADGVLTIEKRGEQYRIHPMGDIEGDGQVREPLENIVAEYKE